MQSLTGQHSKAIFAQLAGVAGSTVVKTIIENHDAWVHLAAADGEISPALEAFVANRQRDAASREKIARQRLAIAPLVHTISRQHAQSA